jgi:hypothetical protein
MKTGYFGRATEEKHKAYHTRVHILDERENCLCRYKPHKTMKFQFCSNGIGLDYVECDKCKDIFLNRCIIDKYELALRQSTGNYTDNLNNLISRIEQGYYK